MEQVLEKLNLILIEKIKNLKKGQLKVVQDLPKQQIKVSKEQRKRQIKMTVTVVGLFLLLLTISCRNSQIDKQFNQIQEQKSNLQLFKKKMNN